MFVGSECCYIAQPHGHLHAPPPPSKVLRDLCKYLTVLRDFETITKLGVNFSKSIFPKRDWTPQEKMRCFPMA